MCHPPKDENAVCKIFEYFTADVTTGLQEEYLNWPPPIFLKLPGLKVVV